MLLHYEMVLNQLDPHCGEHRGEHRRLKAELPVFLSSLSASSLHFAFQRWSWGWRFGPGGPKTCRIEGAF